MKRSTIVASILVLLLSQLVQGNTPQGFSWINIESDKEAMAVVRRALHDPSVTAIREVGVREGFALVMTASREDGATTPDYDRWTIYNLSLATGKSRILVSGYGVKLLDWIGPEARELAITYDHCSECEPATLFTTLHFIKGVGWRGGGCHLRRETPSIPIRVRLYSCRIPANHTKTMFRWTRCLPL